MKRFEATRTRLYTSIAVSSIFVLLALLALFLPDALLKAMKLPTDKLARYLFFGCFLAIFVIYIIASFYEYKKYLRTVDIVNAFIEKCGESAVILSVLYFQEDPENIELIKDFFVHADQGSRMPRKLQKLILKKDSLKYAVIGDNGIYIINHKDIATPEQNILYRKNNTREHTVLTGAQQAVMLEYPECNAFFFFSAAHTKDITQDELIQKLKDLYGKTTDIPSEL